MGLIWGTVLFVLGVAGAILIPVTARVVGDDVKEWLPWITQRLVERAVSRLPEEERDRFEEEWWAHINELPGNLAKVYAAWGCLSASKAINHIALAGDITRIEEVTRRVIEVTISLFLLLFVLPLMLVISILIKLDSRGPLFFKQKRLGVNNIPFFLLKFRSLHVEVLGRQLAEAGSPSVTRVGRVIRALSLDELPQLLNVLRGDVSLVGPLPLPPPSATDASAKSETPIFRRLRHLKPGLVRTVSAPWSRNSVAPAPPKDPWRPRTSLGFFFYNLCVCLIGVSDIACLIGSVVAIIICLTIPVLGLSLIAAMIHFLGFL
jgi:lipopolysaccharide/colanic/teichoic acid biosynthesis glycosyltransferase